MMKTTVFTVSGEENFQGIMGLFERTTDNLFLPSGVYSLWARDSANPVETGNLPAPNTYGVHPVYMIQGSDLTWVGVYTNLAHASDWVITNDNTKGQVGIQTWATGGIIDVTIFFGATA